MYKKEGGTCNDSALANSFRVSMHRRHRGSSGSLCVLVQAAAGWPLNGTTQRRLQPPRCCSYHTHSFSVAMLYYSVSSAVAVQNFASHSLPY